MNVPKLPLPSSCAWCDVPQRGHGQRWHPVPGWNVYVTPERWLIESRMRRRFQWAGRLPTLPDDPAGQRHETEEN